MIKEKTFYKSFMVLALSLALRMAAFLAAMRTMVSLALRAMALLASLRVTACGATALRAVRLRPVAFLPPLLARAVGMAKTWWWLPVQRGCRLLRVG